MIKKLKMKILLWIQGWSGQLNSWAWTGWDKLHREGREYNEHNRDTSKDPFKGTSVEGKD